MPVPICHCKKVKESLKNWLCRWWVLNHGRTARIIAWEQRHGPLHQHVALRKINLQNKITHSDPFLVKSQKTYGNYVIKSTYCIKMGFPSGWNRTLDNLTAEKGTTDTTPPRRSSENSTKVNELLAMSIMQNSRTHLRTAYGTKKKDGSGGVGERNASGNEAQQRVARIEDPTAGKFIHRFISPTRMMQSKTENLNCRTRKSCKYTNKL